MMTTIDIFTSVLEATRDASILALAVGGILWLLGNRITAQWRHLLWLLVVVRLIMPILPTSDFSWQKLLTFFDKPNVENSTSSNGLGFRSSRFTPSASDSLPVNEAISSVSAPETDWEESGTVQSVSVVEKKPPAIYCLAWIWVIGVVLQSIFTTVGWIRFQKKIKYDQPENGKLDSQVLAIAEDLKIRTPKVKVTSDWLPSPALAGWFRPTLLLPTKILSALDEDQLSHIIRHELAHQKRHDVALQWILCALQIIHWFNPMIWWAFHRIRIEAERATDELVLRRMCKEQHGKYGKTLLHLLEHSDSTLKAPGTVGVLENFRDLKKRISAIQSFRSGSRLKSKVLAACLVVGLAVIGLTKAPTEDPKNIADESVAAATGDGNKDSTTVAADRVSNVSNAPPTEKSEPVDLIGQITDENDLPISGASISIYTAKLKTGVSTICPSCYPDCEKESVTDSKGGFEIKDLDSSLRFRILVLAEGYVPKYLWNIDPEEGSIEAVLKQRKLDGVSADKLITGMILESDTDRSVAGARVSPYVWAHTEGGRSYPARHVEKATVTDSAGKFTLVAKRSNLKIGVLIEARGLAKKKHAWITAGEGLQTIKLETGATVTGKVSHEGNPVAGMKIGICQTERWSFTYLRDKTTVTDKNGEFTFHNMPADQHYLYSLKDSSSGASEFSIRTKEVSVSSSEDLLDLGLQKAEPTGIVSGRVFLGDGKKVPVNSEVILSGRRGWASYRVKTGENGTFVFKGIPVGDPYDLSASIDNYRISARNTLPFDSVFRNVTIELESMLKDDIELILAPIKSEVAREVQILQPDGTPAAKCQFALAVVEANKRSYVNIENGVLQGYHPLEVEEANAKGIAVVSPATDRDEHLVVVHQSGWYQMSLINDKTFVDNRVFGFTPKLPPTTIRLNPWVSLKGKVAVPGKRRIHIRSNSSREKGQLDLSVSAEIETDAFGNFSTDRLLARRCWVRAEYIDQKLYYSEWEKRISLSSQKPNQVSIGGVEGQSVIGKLAIPDDIKANTDWKQSSAEIGVGEIKLGFRIEPDGSFKIKNLPAGNLHISIALKPLKSDKNQSRMMRAYSNRSMALPKGVKSEPYDLGVISLSDFRR